MSDINTDLATLRKLVVEACRAFEDLHPDYFVNVSYSTRKHKTQAIDREGRVYYNSAVGDIAVRATIGDV